MACRKMKEDVAYARNTESGCNCIPQFCCWHRKNICHSVKIHFAAGFAAKLSTLYLIHYSLFIFFLYWVVLTGLLKFVLSPQSKFRSYSGVGFEAVFGH